MSDVADRVTRVSADLFEAAAAEGARQSRSAKQQLDHWARVGRAVSTQHTASRRRVEAALAGQRVGHREGDARLHRLQALVEVVDIDLS